MYQLLCLSLFLLALTPAPGGAQYDVRQMPGGSLTGLPFIETTYDLATQAYQEGDFAEAAARGEEVITAAREAGEKEWEARALNLVARSRLAQGERKMPVAALLRQSLQLTKDPDLKLSNLNELRKIAIELRRGEDLQEIAREIATITGEKERKLPRRPKEALKVVANENEVLTQQIDSLAGEQQSLLQAMENQESLIRGMNEEQAKVQLLLAQQRILVDSLSLAKIQDSLTLVQQEMLLNKQQMDIAARDARLSLQRSRLLLVGLLAVMILLSAFALYNRNKNIKKHADQLEVLNSQLEEEQERSESLLLNILPSAVASELKEKGRATARMYPMASVLFTDFSGFTKISDGMDPKELVDDLDYCFRQFDEITAAHGLEKIKTIGDAYMCAGGIPHPDPEHPRHMIKAAMEIQTFLEKWKSEREAEGRPYFSARLGIHSGPLVAGVVGSRKFAYDIWGNTVNLASRMESGGKVGRVNISEATYELVKDHFPCEYRGKVEAKGVGEVGMYFVK